MSLPTVVVSGYLARDPEMRYADNERGTAITNFSIAVNYNRGGRGEDEVEVVDWYNIVAFGRLAESVNQNCVKGRFVTVIGRQKLNRYVDREGQARVNLDVTANDVSYGPRVTPVGEYQAASDYQGGADYQGDPAPVASGQEEDIPW